MKSKSFELKHVVPEKSKHNKTFDFVGFYKSAAETNKHLTENGNLEIPKPKKEDSRRERSPHKGKRKFKNESVDISQICKTGPERNSSFVENTPLNQSKVTSTPINGKNHGSGNCKVKSIMKIKPAEDHPMDGSSLDTSFKSKKRNKSVSFMLEDTEAVVVKKTKSNDSINKQSESKDKVSKKKNFKSYVKDKSYGKENKAGPNNNVETEQESEVISKEHKSNPIKSKKDEEPVNEAEVAKNSEKKRKFKKGKRNKMNDDSEQPVTDDHTTQSSEIGKEKGDNINQNVNAKPEAEIKLKELKGRLKKFKKNEESVPCQATVEAGNQEKRKFQKSRRNKNNEKSEQPRTDHNTEDPDAISKKIKNKKQHVKQQNPQTECDGEPVSKFPKKDIVEDLENLNIGDNPHTLTNLLDEMTVVDKDRKKKLSKKFKKEKSKSVETDKTNEQDSEEVKEKVKWNKRKWNKDKKGDVNEDIATMVVVENLPITIMITYKKLLTNHFVKYGLIKKIGIAEMYPTEESKPVFTTTINFYSDGAATEALDEDETMFEGSRIRVKRSLPPTDTTLVVRSYAELNEQNVTSLFTGAGRIRNIRHLVKGKKSMSTAFVEFDGPESVERAMKMAAGVKVGGKKVHIARFELRKKKEKSSSGVESGAETEDSND